MAFRGDPLADLYNAAKGKAHLAVRYDQEQKFGKARDAYVDAASALSEAARLDPALEKREYNSRICSAYFQRAEALQRMLANSPPSLPPAAAPVANPHRRPPSPSQGHPAAQDFRRQAIPPISPAASNNDEAASLALARKLMAEEEAAQRRFETEQAASAALAQKLSAGTGPAAARTPSPTPSGAPRLSDRPKSPRAAPVHPAAPQPAPQRLGQGQPAHHHGPSDICVKCGQTLPDSGGTNAVAADTGTGNIGSNPPGKPGSDDAATAVRQGERRQQRPTPGGPAAFAGADQPAPELAADVDRFGRMAGARDDFHQDSSVQRPGAADSGTGYRNKNWNDLVRRAQDKVGPKQTPFHERETLADRSAQLQAAQINETSREGVRVNPASDKRGYSIEGYEKEVYIDPNRSIDVALPKGRAEEPAAPAAAASITSAAVLFETAAMGAKLRNTHRVGGERVKEMDHFVASVETPSANLQLPDVAPLVAEMTARGLEPVRLDDGSELHVQARFRDPATGAVSGILKGHAVIFARMIREILTQLLGHLDPFELFYMMTIRADVSVCSLSKENGRLYFNVLVFQQQQVADLATGTIKDQRRIWRYWLQRAALALAGSRAGKPTGLYDPAIRSSFKRHMDALEAASSQPLTPTGSDTSL